MTFIFRVIYKILYRDHILRRKSVKSFEFHVMMRLRESCPRALTEHYAMEAHWGVEI